MAARIDIVENDPATLRLLHHLVVRVGGTTRLFASAEDAEVAMVADPSDGAIIDVHLEGARTGLDLLRSLRSSVRATGVRTLVVSAAATVDDEADALRAGADGWMSKPVSLRRVSAFLLTMSPLLREP